MKLTRNIKTIKLSDIFWLVFVFSISYQNQFGQTQKSNPVSETSDTKTVSQWLKDNAVVLKTVEAGNGFDDLKPLKTVFKDVRIVGLGEETHGTREFFQFKHRMLEFLVKEMGYRIFLIEASYSACFAINDYVMGKNDDGKKALAGQGSWTWKTEEVLAMMDWMKAYNRTVSEDKKVKFLGYDIQVNKPSEVIVQAYLEKVSPEKVQMIKELLGADLMTLNNEKFQGSPEEKKDALAKLAEIHTKYLALLGDFALNEKFYTDKSSKTEFEKAFQHMRILTQYIDAYESEKSPGRDYFMAENIKRLLDAEPLDTKAVVWAHNFHIRLNDPSAKSKPTGEYLRKSYGSKYYAIGFSFNKGAFQALNLDPKDKYKLTEFQAKPVLEFSADWYLALPGIKNYFIDFRQTVKQPAIDKWLNTNLQMRDIGSVYLEKNADDYYTSAVLGENFDGLVFLETATRARPN